MRKFKRTLAAVLAVALSATALAACGKDKDSSKAGDATKAQGKVYNIYVWNEEFKGHVEKYCKDCIPSDVKVNWIITPNQGGAYQNKLDEALMAQANVGTDEKVDMFLIEADYALKYVNNACTVPVEDIGVTADDVKNQYEYTKEIATDTKSKKLKAVSWQAAPGLFSYRRSIAKEVLGVEEPADVQEFVKDWATFDDTAKKMKDKGYFMVSGYDDTYRVYSNNMDNAWLNENNELTGIDPQLKAYVDQTKKYTDNGWNEKTSLWGGQWGKGMGKDGKVFGYFWSTWGFQFSLHDYSMEKTAKDGGKEEVGNGTYGDWAATVGPKSYYWGGTWICSANGSDNTEITAKIMKKLTCDSATMKQLTLDTGDFTNNMPAMEEVAASDYKNTLLGGQNHIGMFTDAAKKIKMDKTTKYDQTLNEAFQGAMKNYFDGAKNDDGSICTYDDALKQFYKTVNDKAPVVKTPDAK